MKNHQTVGNRKVVFYGRVSTEHEEQTYALGNQMQWYEELKKNYPNWIIIERYVDDGITGTQAKKRPEFMRMIDDAKTGKFDLIVTREVARFARNTVECLEITRQLKNYGVEVFFVQDGIRTMDNEGEMILTIRAMVAQEESRKMSDRIKAGQAISRKNGVLYGNGNLLGYDRVGNTYVINQEQAKTVRMIFDLYESGLGVQAIRDELIKRERINSSGFIKWDSTRILRCLKNTIYKGIMAYNKSYRNNFLEQKVIVNHDETTFEYVAATFEPIISEEQWEHCKLIRESRRNLRIVNVDGKANMQYLGMHKSGNVWTKKMRCRCGSSMRMDKWRPKLNGERPVGYKCYNQLNKGANKIANRESEGFCDMRAICGWKLEMMAKVVFRKVWKDSDILEKSIIIFINETVMEQHDIERIRNGYRLEIKKLSEKAERLIEMRLNGEIDRDTYLRLKAMVDADKKQADQQLLDYENLPRVAQSHPFSKEEIKKHLLEFISPNNIDFDNNIIDKFVTQIKVESETEFSWYLRFDVEVDFNLGKKLYYAFTIPFKEALKYRNKRKQLLRQNQYRDLVVKVFI
ncbi:MAG: recombinase family protein [Clostridia bacterium]|nr:recombinase family protein [Clostridia bacterium]